MLEGVEADTSSFAATLHLLQPRIRIARKRHGMAESPMTSGQWSLTGRSLANNYRL